MYCSGLGWCAFSAKYSVYLYIGTFASEYNQTKQSFWDYVSVRQLFWSRTNIKERAWGALQKRRPKAVDFLVYREYEKVPTYCNTDVQRYKNAPRIVHCAECDNTLLCKNVQENHCVKFASHTSLPNNAKARPLFGPKFLQLHPVGFQFSTVSDLTHKISLTSLCSFICFLFINRKSRK